MAIIIPNLNRDNEKAAAELCYDVESVVKCFNKRILEPQVEVGQKDRMGLVTIYLENNDH